jgi:hypothetical protein
MLAKHVKKAALAQVSPLVLDNYAFKMLNVSHAREAIQLLAK